MSAKARLNASTFYRECEKQTVKNLITWTKNRVCDLPSTFFYKEAEMMKYCKRHHNLFHLHSFPPSSFHLFIFSFFLSSDSRILPMYLFSIVLVSISMYMYVYKQPQQASEKHLDTHAHTHTLKHRAHHESP